MNILVTGGAGYIGSVLTEELARQGHNVIVFDNLTQGHRAAVIPEAVFIHADLGDGEALEDTFQHHAIDAVMHLAADTSVANSMTEPGRFFQNNVACGVDLLECMLKHGVKKIIFSSSAAIYGQPEEIPVAETAPALPINAYGESKLIFERILKWYTQAKGLSSISLRYFNVAGASRRFGSDHYPETSLIPRVIRVALGQVEYLPVFGTDYDTEDGTCVRDYIHVLDIAQAHILALQHLEERAGIKVYNLGNGVGYSVMEVVEIAGKVTGTTIPVKVNARRNGDPACLVASSALARLELGWIPRYHGLESIVKSTWKWQKEHPVDMTTRRHRV